MITLRPYQQEMVDAIRLQYQLGKRSVLAVLPTGGGKTRAFSHIAEAASRKGNRVLILVHRAELLDQASRSLPFHHGLIAAGRAMDLSHAVQVASIQTVARRLHLLPRDYFQLLVVDEAHHTSAGTWEKVLAHFSSARLLGVTATPIRSDGRGLGEHYRQMVQGPSAAWLTDNGYLARARVLAPPGFSADGLRKRMGDFDPRAAEDRVRSIHGDCVAHYRQHLHGQTAIAFCCSIAHAEAVAAVFNASGIAAASIDGTMDTSTRRHLLEQLGAGRLKVLTSCALIGEGVDVPSVGGCLMLRPTASVALHLQMIGRCLRPSGDKVAVVLDHVGNCLRLGHHLEERDWSLEGTPKRDRQKAPSVKVCPVCFAANPAGASYCCECRHQFRAEVRELEQVDGELVEMRRDQSFRAGDLVRLKKWDFEEISFKVLSVIDKEHIQVQWPKDSGIGFQDYITTAESKNFELVSRRSLKKEQGSAQSLDDLRQLAQQRGYKRGWAERVYEARLARRHGI